MLPRSMETSSRPPKTKKTSDVNKERRVIASKVESENENDSVDHEADGTSESESSENLSSSASEEVSDIWNI